MKAMRLMNSVSGLVLMETDVSQPQPGSGELSIRVCAVGVTPTELSRYPTTHSKTGEQRSGAVPGHEFSGVIAGTGSGVPGFEVGQEVYGMNDWYADGAMAEYCITQPSSVALKPPRLTHVEAASVPISALTAWQGLFDRAQLQPGERVLVQGGAGGVGLFAVQLAHLRGAHVIATASARNLDFVRRLGAEQVIDYRAARFAESVTEVDVVLDTVGGETLERSWGVLAPKGRMVTVASTAEAATDERTKRAFFIVEPNGAQLAEIGNMLETRRLRPVVDAVVPFSEADAAYRGKIAERLGRGKLVVAVTSS
jgi:NADPH:quinone reductase-like Zn-dependent oxidoreductase